MMYWYILCFGLSEFTCADSAASRSPEGPAGRATADRNGRAGSKTPSIGQGGFHRFCLFGRNING